MSSDNRNYQSQRKTTAGMSENLLDTWELTQILTDPLQMTDSKNKTQKVGNFSDSQSTKRKHHSLVVKGLCRSATRFRSQLLCPPVMRPRPPWRSQWEGRALSPVPAHVVKLLLLQHTEELWALRAGVIVPFKWKRRWRNGGDKWKRQPG